MASEKFYLQAKISKKKKLKNDGKKEESSVKKSVTTACAHLWPKYLQKINEILKICIKFFAKNFEIVKEEKIY